MISKEILEDLVKQVTILKPQDLRDNVLMFNYNRNSTYIMSQDEIEDLRDLFVRGDCCPAMICYGVDPKILTLEQLEQHVKELQEVIKGKKS
jgi:hypothetical protein